MKVDWKNLENIEDYFITYLLYKDSFTVSQISRIRNITIEEVNDHLIKSKMSLRKMGCDGNRRENGITEEYLTMDKEDRIKYIESLRDEELDLFKKKVYQGVLNTQNLDDLLIYIWSCGELRDEVFLKILYPLVNRKNVNIRRFSYSAIGKIGSEESRYTLELGLLDSSPQVRQYCAKYLSNVGNLDTVRILENLVKNKAKFEKEYVIRACKATIDILKEKFA